MSFKKGTDNNRIVIYHGREVWNVETNLSNRVFTYVKQLQEE
ncbi:MULTISPECIES: hypothetical protein [unclassified Petrotoga]|nr:MULTISPECIES: hypothetical protein [unclassified Petrotoga]